MAQAINNMADFSLVGQWNSHYCDFLNGRPNGREDWRGIIDYAYNGTQVLAKNVSISPRHKDIGSFQIDPSWPDPYEPDDYPYLATEFDFFQFEQNHTFHYSQDRDWVYFLGYKGNNYLIETFNQEFEEIQMRLFDPNYILMQTFYNELWGWRCPKTGYYFLLIEPLSYIAPFNYYLLVEELWGAPPVDILGRVVKIVNNEKVGLNGLSVFYDETYQTLTGSLRNVENSPLDPSMTDGWYFFESVPAPFDTCEIRVTIKDDPNIILATSFPKIQEAHSVCWISDIIINQSYTIQESGNHEVATSFEDVYERWQENKGQEYPLCEDNDNDGLNNQEEFLYGTDPDHTTLKCLLYPGLNLIPFCISNYPYTAGKFCFDKLEEWKSIMGYNQQNQEWDYWDINSEGANFPLEEGKGYFIYKYTPEIIFQEEQTSVRLLDPGINLIKVSPPPETEIYSSFQFLKDRRAENVKSISHYNYNQKDRNKEIGSWQTSYWFFGQPAGSEFSISSNEAYLVEVVEN